MSAHFEFRTDDKPVRCRKKLFQVCRRHAGTEIHRQMRLAFDFHHILFLGRITGHCAGHDHNVAAHEFHCVRRLSDAHVRRDRVRAVFLFHVHPDLHVVRADKPAIAQQLRRRGLDDALVCHMGECESFRADEIQSRRMRHGHRFHIGPGENLDAAWQTGCHLHRARDQRHARDDFRSDVAAQIRRIVHVFQHHAVNARVAINLRLAHRLRLDCRQRQSARRRARQRADMNHGNDRLGRFENRIG